MRLSLLVEFYWSMLIDVSFIHFIWFFTQYQ
jgi:hypothetical protein